MTFDDAITIAKNIFEIFKTVFISMWNIPILRILIIILIISYIYSKIRRSKSKYKIINYIKNKIKNKKAENIKEKNIIR